LRDVASDQLNNGLQANLVIDRDTASRLGILPQAIDDTLYDAFGQRQVSTMFTQLNQYHVVLEVDPQFRMTPDDLKKIYVKAGTATVATSGTSGGASIPVTTATVATGATASGAGTSSVASTSATTNTSNTATGTQVPLSAFTHLEQRNAPLAINHLGQFPVVNLSFNLAPGVSLGDATKAIEQAEQDEIVRAGRAFHEGARIGEVGVNARVVVRMLRVPLAQLEDRRINLNRIYLVALIAQRPCNVVSRARPHDQHPRIRSGKTEGGIVGIFFRWTLE
jgi:multidrug efflux pump subunit AcrB